MCSAIKVFTAHMMESVRSFCNETLKGSFNNAPCGRPGSSLLDFSFITAIAILLHMFISSLALLHYIQVVAPFGYDIVPR